MRSPLNVLKGPDKDVFYHQYVWGNMSSGQVWLLEWWYKNVNGQWISNLILVDHTKVCAKSKIFVCGSEAWTINSDIDSSGKIYHQTRRLGKSERTKISMKMLSANVNTNKIRHIHKN